MSLELNAEVEIDKQSYANQSQTSVGSLIYTTGDINLKSDKDINQKGSAVISESGDITYNAGGDINIMAGMNTYKEQTSTDHYEGDITLSLNLGGNLVGGKVAGDDLTVKVNELNFEDIYDHNYSSQSASGWSTSLPVSWGNPLSDAINNSVGKPLDGIVRDALGKTPVPGKPNQQGDKDSTLHIDGSTTFTKSRSGEEQEQTTHATITDGTIIIKGQEQDADSELLEGLNRDADKAQELTKDELTGGLDYSVTIDHEVVVLSGKLAVGVTKEVINGISILTTDERKEVFLSAAAKAMENSAEANDAFLKEQLANETNPDKQKKIQDYMDNLGELKKLYNDLNPSFWDKVGNIFTGKKIDKKKTESDYYKLQGEIKNLPYYEQYRDDYVKAVKKAWSADPQFQDAVENFDKWSPLKQEAFLEGLLKSGQDLFGKTKTSTLDWKETTKSTGAYSPDHDKITMNSRMSSYTDAALSNLNLPATNMPNINVMGVLGHEMTHSMQWFLYQNNDTAKQGDLFGMNFNMYENGYNDLNRYKNQIIERDVRKVQADLAFDLKMSYYANFYQPQTQIRPTVSLPATPRATTILNRPAQAMAP